MFDDYLYGRISDDELGLEKGVTRQLADGRGLSAATGGRVVGEWSDNDISALRGAPREGYDKLIAAITVPNPTGRQRRIICQHTSRIWRNRVERAAGIDLLGRAGVIIKPVNGPELDLRTAAGRQLADILGGVDTGESETKAERVADEARARANEGRANGAVLYGWTRIYEYDSKGKVVGFRDEENATEAAIVRELVDRLLAGESLIALTADLNRRGIPAPGAGHNRKHRQKGQDEQGSRWNKSSVRKIVLRPANIGLRIYHRGRADEALIPAAWPKIVDPDKHDRVVTLLSDPARSIESPGSRQHLLTYGIGEAGTDGCGGHLRVAMRGSSRYGVKKPTYVCDRDGCVGRNVELTNRRVDHLMIKLLQRPDVVDLLSGSAGESAKLLERAEALRARLAKAAADCADEKITDDQLRIITAKLKPQLDAVEAQARALRPSPHVGLAVATVRAVSTAGAKAKQKWNELTVTQKRAVMEAFGVRVIILPTSRRGPGFDPTSVKVVPRSRSGPRADG